METEIYTEILRPLKIKCKIVCIMDNIENKEHLCSTLLLQFNFILNIIVFLF